MVYDPNTDWTTAVAADVQAPVYYLSIDGVSSQDFSTHEVKGAATTKTVVMETPSGSLSEIDLIDGSVPVQTVSVELMDIDGVVTALVATEASGAEVASLINKKATLYGGYRHLDESDYAPIFTGRITQVSLNRKLTGYVLRLSDFTFLLDQEIMLDASNDRPVTIVGNLVNVYYAILTGTFSTTHSTFPLTSVSTSATDSAAPDGLSLTDADLNTTQMVNERDIWHAADTVELVINQRINARAYLQDQLFKVFQCWPARTADGLVGLRFITPALPATAAPVLDPDDYIVELSQWDRRFDQHLNQFRYYCETTKGSGTFDVALYETDTADDTADRALTGETVELRIESDWLSDDYSGASIATELAGRQRIRYLTPPAEVKLTTNFKRRAVEQGDVVAVTHDELPDLLRGVRGLEGHLMTVLTVRPDFRKGQMEFTLIDTGYSRYGVIAPSGQSDYTASSAQDRDSFFFISDATDHQMSNGDPGFNLI
jgi:hypothetical protein